MILSTKNRDINGGPFLVRLKNVIEDQIQPSNIRYWAFQDIDAVSNYFFELTYQDFEKTTREISKGMIVENEEFRKFLVNLVDFCSGIIVALPNKESNKAIFILENVDSSEWILETNDNTIINRLLMNGWNKTKYESLNNYYTV